MLFTSYKFILFLLILFILYYAIPSKHQWKLLLIFSYAFYLFAGPKYIIYILVSSVTIHITALLIQKITDEQKEYLSANKETMTREDKKEYKLSCKSRQRKWLVLGLLINFGILFGVKYTGFFIKNVNSFMSIFGKNDVFPSVNIVLPLGISFYTLQATGYLIDVYRNVVRAQTNIFRTSLFISFFPQLIQGPISRYGDLSKTLYEAHAFDSAEFFKGIQRIIWGFFKKMVIADCVATGVLTIVGDLSTYNGAYVLVVIFLYTLDLYADFTGGIDITIGIAQSLGIKVEENFEHPYFSKSLKEYWRRWHITMCEWFRIYVFYSISSGKTIKKVTKFTRNHFGEYIGKRLPVYATSFITWFATGIWHGASWNFVLWGVYYGLFLLLEKFVLQKYLKKIPSWLCTVYTMLVVMIGWVFFSQTDFGALGHYLGTMFGIGASGFIDKTALYYLKTGFILLLISILMCRPAPYQYFKRLVRRRPVAAVIINLILFALSIAYMVYNSYTPFLYAKF